MTSLCAVPSEPCFGRVTLSLDLAPSAWAALARCPDSTTVRARLAAWVEAAWACETGLDFPCTIALASPEGTQAFVAVALSVQAFGPEDAFRVVLHGRALTRAGLPGGASVALEVSLRDLSGAARGLDGTWRPLSAHAATATQLSRLSRAHLSLLELLEPRPVAAPHVRLAAPAFLRDGLVLFGVHAELLQSAAKSLGDFVTPQDLAEAIGCSLLQATDLLDALVASGWLEEVQGSYYQGLAPWHDFIGAPHMLNAAGEAVSESLA